MFRASLVILAASLLLSSALADEAPRRYGQAERGLVVLLVELDPAALDLRAGLLQVVFTGLPDHLVPFRKDVVQVHEAAALEAGEILIAPITDVGWTPYFSLIAGLATDVGSAVSHGAVVAREYGLPAVVNLRVATSRFRTGDLVTLDGAEALFSGQQFAGFAHLDRAEAKRLMASLKPKR